MQIIDYLLIATIAILILIVLIRILWVRSRGRYDSTHPRIKETIGRKAGTDYTRADQKAATVEPLQKRTSTSEIPRQEDSKTETEEDSAPRTSPDELKEEISADPIFWIKSFGAPMQKRLMAIDLAGEMKMTEAVSALIEVLYEPEELLSEAAAESLGKIGDPRAIEPLLEITKRNDQRLLKHMPAMAGAVEETGEKSQSDDPKDLLNETNPFKFKEMVVFKIDLLPREYFQSDGTPVSRKELVSKGLKDNDQMMRKIAAKAAIGMEDPELIDPLIEALENPFEVESVRYMAAEALGESNDGRAWQPLLKALKDENVAVRYSAAAALGGIRGDAILSALIETLSDENEFVRSSAACSIGQHADSQALNALFGALSDSDEVVRFSVAKAIAGFGSETVLPEIRHRITEAVKTEKIALLEVLGQIKDAESINLLRQSLKDPDSDISFKASISLMGQENLEIIDELVDAARRLDRELVELLKNKESVAKAFDIFTSKPQTSNAEEEAAFSNLHSVSGADDGALEKLRQGLRHESPNVRGCAANALGDFNAPEAAGILVDALSDMHEYVRACAVSSIGKLRRDDLIDNLQPLVTDPSEDVRYALAKALGAIGTDRAAEELRKIITVETSREIKRIARASIEQIQKNRTDTGNAM